MRNIEIIRFINVRSQYMREDSEIDIIDLIIMLSSTFEHPQLESKC